MNDLIVLLNIAIVDRLFGSSPIRMPCWFPSLATILPILQVEMVLVVHFHDGRIGIILRAFYTTTLFPIRLAQRNEFPQALFGHVQELCNGTYSMCVSTMIVSD